MSKNIKILFIYIGIITAIGTFFGILTFVQYNPNFEIKNDVENNN